MLANEGVLEVIVLHHTPSVHALLRAHMVANTCTSVNALLRTDMLANECKMHAHMVSCIEDC